MNASAEILSDDSRESGQRDAPSEDVSHMDVVSGETGAVERSGQLHVAVNALLAQHRKPRSRAADDQRRGDILRRIE